MRTLAATLPAGRDNATAVYLDGLNKIVILGGWYYSGGTEQYANSVYVFDAPTLVPACATTGVKPVR